MLEHPNHVLAISTVRMQSTTEAEDSAGTIVCLATFSVERLGDTEARFASIRWSTLQEHCERDVLFTSLALTALLRLEGQVPATIPGMHLALCEAFLRQRPRAICAPLLRRFADETRATLIPAELAA